VNVDYLPVLCYINNETLSNLKISIMNKQEFLDKFTSIENKQRELRHQKRMLEEEYIKSNIEFKIGDKVVVTTPEGKAWNGDIFPEKQRFAFVNGFSQYNGGIEYKINKCKKDGTQSKHSDYLGHKETMKLA
jgi:hypothetical protein